MDHCDLGIRSVSIQHCTIRLIGRWVCVIGFVIGAVDRERIQHGVIAVYTVGARRNGKTLVSAIDL